MAKRGRPKNKIIVPVAKQNRGRPQSPYAFHKKIAIILLWIGIKESNPHLPANIIYSQIAKKLFTSVETVKKAMKVLNELKKDGHKIYISHDGSTVLIEKPEDFERMKLAMKFGLNPFFDRIIYKNPLL